MIKRTPEKDMAHAIYRAWQTDERWLRMDLATICTGNPLSFFWAEIAARAALDEVRTQQIIAHAYPVDTQEL